MAPLLGALEREILPRLVLAHHAPEARNDEGAEPPVPAPGEVEQLSRLAAQGKLTDAIALVERAFAGGASLERVLLDLVAPAARALGQEWLDDACSFTEVTAGLGTLQQLVLALRPHNARAPTRGSILLAAAPGEQHTLGLFVLAELVRRAGHDVRVETAPTADGLVALVAAEPYLAVGFSVGSERPLEELAGLLPRLRQRSRRPDMPILLGGSIDGRAFAQAHGAALWAADAREALDWIDAPLDRPFRPEMSPRFSPMMANERSSSPHVEPAAIARLLASSADASMVLDATGTIHEVAGATAAPAWQKLVGKRWRDTVTKESQAKVDSLLTECASAGQSKSREINQLLVDGEHPFRFTAVRVAPNTLVALGRDLSAVAVMQQQMLGAQQALEREYARLRQDESRYRMLFHLSSEGVLIVDGATLKVLDVNPAAAAALEQDARHLTGRPFLDMVSCDDPEDLRASLKAVAAGGQPATCKVLLRESKRPATLTVSASRQGQSAALLVQLASAPGATPNAKRMQMLTALDALPDAFVVLDESLRVLGANPMFCELAQVNTEREAVGQPISRWLGRPGVDGNVVASTLREHGVVRNFATVMRGNLGQSSDVILSAVSALESDFPCIAFVLRPASARTSTTAPTAHSVEQLRELVGQVSLKELVRESAELVERMCIEAALELTGNNRASAAQILGLSRQGLYSKLRRHGLGS